MLYPNSAVWYGTEFVQHELAVFLIYLFLLGSWMNTTMIENRKILDGLDLDGFDKVKYAFFFQCYLCAVINPFYLLPMHIYRLIL